MLKRITQFLSGLGAAASGGGDPVAQLCLFGKHPGWDDHMQDLGLRTERLVEVRRTLYAEGIAGNIDIGAWEKLAPAGRLERFEHSFVWRFQRDEFVFGRIWSSRDARGRTKYPMIACVHAKGLNLAKISVRASEAVTRAMEACRSELDAHAVKSIFARESEALKAQASAMIEAGDDRFDRVCRAAVAKDASLSAGGEEKLERVAYALHREAEPALKKGMSQISRGVQFRLPRVEGMGTGSSGWAWTAVTMDLLNQAAGIPDGMLAIEAIDAGWVDLLIGRVTASELFCLRASQASIPLTSDVPFTIDSSFSDRVRSRVSMWRSDDGARKG